MVVILLSILFRISFILGNPTKSQKLIGQKNNLRKIDELSDDIVIIHVNDVHCGIQDTVGYDGFVLYRKQLQEKYKHIITVDVGDHVQGGTIGALMEKLLLKL